METKISGSYRFPHLVEKHKTAAPKETAVYFFMLFRSGSDTCYPR